MDGDGDGWMMDVRWKKRCSVQYAKNVEVCR
jgi:hypothetical protein